MFDWRGFAAFEKDFKSQALGGWDHNYVDNVDAQWYTGHGSANGITFKSSVDDKTLSPNEARWGDRDLEWMQLESCQVLRDTNGTHDYFSRWGGAVDGLHILNGFHTNAYCVGGGTGGTFASLPVPPQDPVVDVPGADRPQRVGADGDRQGAVRRRVPLDGQHQLHRRHQHR